MRKIKIIFSVLISLILLKAESLNYDVHLQGWGAVRLGMTPAEIEKITGNKLIDDGSSNAEAGCYIYKFKSSSLGIGFMFNKVNKKTELVRIYISDKKIRTSAGIGIGDSEKKVISTYKKIDVQKHQYQVNGHYLYYFPTENKFNDYAFNFETDGNKVTQYSVGKKNEIRYVEGCQ